MVGIVEERRTQRREREAARGSTAAAARESAAEMGLWIADYFEDAGYEGWDSNPQIFKAMLLNAFPPIGAQLKGRRSTPMRRRQCSSRACCSSFSRSPTRTSTCATSSLGCSAGSA